MNKKTILKNLNMIAIPLILQSIFNIIIGITDQTIIGKLSIQAYGGVTATSQFYNTILGILGCSVIVFNIRGSREIGTNNKEKFLYEFHNSLILQLILGILLSVTLLLFNSFILKIILGLNELAYQSIKNYYFCICITAIFQMLCFSFNTYFKIKKTTKYILYCGIFSSILNAFLDYVLVLGKLGFPKLGAIGAGIATLISIFMSFFIYFLLTFKEIQYMLSFKLDFKNIWYRFTESFPLIGQEVLEGSLFSIALISIVSYRSEILLGGYSLLVNIFSFLTVPLFMYAQATLTLVSEHNNKAKINNCFPIIRLSILFSGIVITALILVLIGFKDKILTMMNTNPSIVEIAQQFLLLYSFMILSKIPTVICSHALQALNSSKYVLHLNFGVNLMLFAIVSLLMNLFENDMFFMNCILILMTISYLILSFFEYRKLIS